MSRMENIGVTGGEEKSVPDVLEEMTKDSDVAKQLQCATTTMKTQLQNFCLGYKIARSNSL